MSQRAPDFRRNSSRRSNSKLSFAFGESYRLLAVLKRLSLRSRVSRWLDSLGLNIDSRQAVLPQNITAARVLPKMARRFFHAGDRAATGETGEELHRFRILAKKFRYTLELFTPLYGAKAQEWLREIKSVQSALGAMNDYLNVQRMAIEAGCDKKLRVALKHSERRRVRRFRRAWGERFSKSVAAQWVEALGATGQKTPVPRKPIATHVSQRTLAAKA